MKYQTTRRDVLNGYGCVLSAGFCTLQNLLAYESPRAYTCGVYGWNADIYELGGFALVTGYRPFGKAIDWDTAREFERRAESIRNRRCWGFEAKRKHLHALAVELCRQMAQEARA